MEVWKDIKGYEGTYQVSNLGRVKALADNTRRTHKGEHILSQTNSRGYRLVSLSKDGKMRSFSVHRLVAVAFIKRVEGKNEIDHINTIRKDNRVENLRWCSPKENNANPITRVHKAECKKGSKNPNYKKDMSTAISRLALANSKAVVQLDAKGKPIRRYSNIQEAQRATNVNASNIGRVCNGERVTAGGFKWEFAK